MMKFIDSFQIEQLLREGRDQDHRIDAILARARELKRLTLTEAAILLNSSQPQAVQKILAAAAEVKDTIYGRRIVLFAPLYISNYCTNGCVYCAFKADNHSLVRRCLEAGVIKNEVSHLLKRGHKRILLVSGESAPAGRTLIDYYVEAIEAVYSVAVGPHKIKRVNINCAPLGVEEFRRLKKAGIGTYQLFQETYHEPTYRAVHPSGPKSDPDNRLDAIDRAFRAGIDDVGLGVLYGLYEAKFETLALLQHVRHLEDTFGVGPHTISVPRIEPAAGSEFSRQLPYRVGDGDFKKIVAVLRLSVPYAGLILSTRELPELRDELFGLGVSQVSAESSTAPGGYCAAAKSSDGQFAIADHRSLDEVVGSMIEKEFIPSFCAACYRKARTGEAFMRLARPGTIKGQCGMNALITLKEYLDDFASDRVRHNGYQLIDRKRRALDDDSRGRLERFFVDIDHGLRDEYV